MARVTISSHGLSPMVLLSPVVAGVGDEILGSAPRSVLRCWLATAVVAAASISPPTRTSASAAAAGASSSATRGSFSPPTRRASCTPRTAARRLPSSRRSTGPLASARTTRARVCCREVALSWLPVAMLFGELSWVPPSANRTRIHLQGHAHRVLWPWDRWGAHLGQMSLSGIEGWSLVRRLVQA
jgi:hypothetical protein